MDRNLNECFVRLKLILRHSGQNTSSQKSKIEAEGWRLNFLKIVALLLFGFCFGFDFGFGFGFAFGFGFGFDFDFCFGFGFCMCHVAIVVSDL